LAPAATFLRPSRTIAWASRSDLADQLCTLVLEDVLDLDLTRDRDAIVRDGGRAELLVEHDVAPLGAKGDLDRVSEGVDAALERAPRILVEEKLLVSHSSSVSIRATVTRA
jgi:hypothetical protein